MDIKPATAPPPGKVSAAAYFDLVERLRALDGVDAEVLRRAPGWMVLRTPLGKLLTANSLPLQDGDRVRLRIVDHGGQPLLKLAPLPRRPLAPLAFDAGDQPRLAAALRATAGKLILGIVEASDARAVEARFTAGRAKLPPIAGAARGDWLLLRQAPDGARLEAIPVEREAVNRALLRRLLPDLQDAPANNLSRLVGKLRRGIDRLARQSAAGMATPAAPGARAPATNPPVNPAPAGPRVAPTAPAATDAAAPVAAQGTPSPGAPAAPTLQQLFAQLPRLPEIDGAAIRKWFEFLQLARPAGAGQVAGTAASLPELLRRLGDSERLGNELDAVLRARGRAAAGADDGPPPPPRDALMQLARDVARLAEQGLAQNLGGRASAGLQQEAQQPFTIGLTVPLLERDAVHPLRIDLQQRGRDDARGAAGWEIHLNFEFAGLGAVSCHGVLAEQRLAASFYSDLPATRERIEAALPELRRRLSQAGFDPGELHSFAGGPPRAATPPTGASPGLIDLRA